MAGAEGTIPDTSTLSKSIKKKTKKHHHHPAKLLETDPLALIQDPSLLWKGIVGKFYHTGKPGFFSHFLQGGTKSTVRDEGAWLKGITLLFQKVLNLHYNSWLIKTKI